MWSSGLFVADAAKYTITNRYLIGVSQYISEIVVLDPSANCDEILIYFYGGLLANSTTLPCAVRIPFSPIVELYNSVTAPNGFTLYVYGPTASNGVTYVGWFTGKSMGNENRLIFKLNGSYQNGHSGLATLLLLKEA